MYPIVGVFQIGPRELPITSYGVLVCIGLIVAAAGSLRVARQLRLDLGACIALLGLGSLGAFAGAIALHGIVQWMRLGSLLAAIRAPGVASFGGLLGLLATLPLAARWLRLPLFALTDRALPAIVAGHAFGRLGCLLGGCCFGGFWDGPLAIHYTHPLAPAAISSLGRHPVPLYEATVLFAVAAACAIRPPDAAGSGQRTRRYLVGYLALRLGLECLRGDDVRGVLFHGAVSVAQLIAGALLLCAVGWRIAIARGPRAAGAFRVAGPFATALFVGSTLGSHATAERSLRLPLATADTVSIPAGWFEMGSDALDVEFAVALCRQTADDVSVCVPELFSDEQPRHRVYVSAFQIDRSELSRAAYQRCVQDSACPPPPSEGAGSRGASEPPAAMLSWQEASGYCAWRAGRLPTEAEWERAARGDGVRRFPWGRFWNPRLANHGTSARRTGSAAWPRAACGPGCDGFQAAAPVTAFLDGKSQFGVLQMAGNAWEWTADRYDPAAYGRAQPVDPRVGQGERIAIRGGSWRSPGYSLRVTQRAGIKPDERRPDVGFRCAYDSP